MSTSVIQNAHIIVVLYDSLLIRSNFIAIRDKGIGKKNINCSHPICFKFHDLFQISCYLIDQHAIGQFTRARELAINPNWILVRDNEKSAAVSHASASPTTSCTTPENIKKYKI